MPEDFGFDPDDVHKSRVRVAELASLNVSSRKSHGIYSPRSLRPSTKHANQTCARIIQDPKAALNFLLVWVCSAFKIEVAVCGVAPDGNTRAIVLSIDTHFCQANPIPIATSQAKIRRTLRPLDNA